MNKQNYELDLTEIINEYVFVETECTSWIGQLKQLKGNNIKLSNAFRIYNVSSSYYLCSKGIDRKSGGDNIKFGHMLDIILILNTKIKGIVKLSEVAKKDILENQISLLRV